MLYEVITIIIQLLTVVIPQLESLKKEGPSGQRKITQYTRYGTVLLSIIQGTFIAVGLEGMAGPGGEAIVLDPGLQFKLMTMLTLTSGTAFIMWLGEQMTERGIGNGISLVITSYSIHYTKLYESDLPPPAARLCDPASARCPRVRPGR